VRLPPQLPPSLDWHGGRPNLFIVRDFQRRQIAGNSIDTAVGATSEIL
jgi:hypothetical protein